MFKKSLYNSILGNVDYKCFLMIKDKIDCQTDYKQTANNPFKYR